MLIKLKIVKHLKKPSGKTIYIYLLILNYKKKDLTVKIKPKN